MGSTLREVRGHRSPGRGFDPLSPETVQDPYPEYAWLRENDPVHWSPVLNGWILTRHGDVSAVLRDHRRWSNDFSVCDLTGWVRAQIPPPERRSLLFLDPPEHSRLRALAGGAFTGRALRRREPRIRRIA